MASTFFTDFNQNNPVVAAWLNDINNGVYSGKGLPRLAQASSAAWVRFFVSGGVVAIQQSNNIVSVTRSSLGIYVISYPAMGQATNCYEISMDQPGFAFRSAETLTSVTINCTNTANTAFDPGFVSVVIHGAN